MSQETNLSFEHLTVNDGLSQNSVLCLLQDDLERIWIGTREGLNCYDGERVHHFHPLPDEPNSIMDYKIIGMEQLGEHLFILGASGVSILNIKTQQITRRRIQQCTAIKSYRDRLYMGTESGMLYSMDTSNFELTVEINIKSAIRSLSGESKLLIGTPKDGLFTFDVQEKTLSHLTKTRNIYDINDCLSTGDGKILVATEFQGLFYIDASGETLAVFN
ncbi:MAG: two-component regulator propeller domain-containing protein, partial [Bacteroidota bacterium]